MGWGGGRWSSEVNGGGCPKAASTGVQVANAPQVGGVWEQSTNWWASGRNGQHLKREQMRGGLGG